MSMPFFLKRDWWWPETRSLARIPTHVHTEPWERFPQAWEHGYGSRHGDRQGLVKVPSAIKFQLVGKPAKWVSGKDVILHIIGMIGVDGALYKSMEFVGEGIRNLSMDDRFTICNMAIEAGGKNGIFPVDELAVEYMKEHSKRIYRIPGG